MIQTQTTRDHQAELRRYAQAQARQAQHEDPGLE
jgi:hypothetical protein